MPAAMAKPAARTEVTEETIFPPPPPVPPTSDISNAALPAADAAERGDEGNRRIGCGEHDDGGVGVICNRDAGEDTKATAFSRDASNATIKHAKRGNVAFRDFIVAAKMRSAALLRRSGSAAARQPILPACIAVDTIRPLSVAASAHWHNAAHDVLVSKANASSAISRHSSLELNSGSRWFSSSSTPESPKPDDKADTSSKTQSSDGEVIGETDPDTATGVNRTIRMNPDGFSRRILPGSYAMKVNPRTQTERKLLAERVFGYFWMFKDLELTKEKPILGNEGCIDETDAERFPALGGKNDARGELPITLTDEVATMPDFGYRNNRAMDPTAQCTLVGLSYREFGNKMLPSWINPFKEALCGPASPRRNRVEVVQISIQEGFALRMLKGMVKSGFRKAVPAEDHERTLLFFGSDQNFKDVLRCHNTCTGYVFLLDGIGRIRWAGSGKPTDEEMRTLTEVAKELTPVTDSSNAKMKGKQRMNKR